MKLSLLPVISFIVSPKAKGHETSLDNAEGWIIEVLYTFLLAFRQKNRQVLRNGNTGNLGMVFTN